MKIFKRWRTILLLVVVLAPATSFAILPLIYGLGLVLGASPEIISALGISSAVIGSAIAYVTFGSNPSTAKVNAPLLVQINPSAPMPTPTGWTAPSTTSWAVPPPTVAYQPGTWNANSVDVSILNGSTPTAGYTDPILFAQTMCNTKYGVGTGIKLYGEVVVNGSNYISKTQNFGCFGVGGTGLASWSMYFGKGCDSGYIINSGGTGCVLNAEQQVDKPSDGKCEITALGGFAKDLRDPDCANTSEVTVTPTRVEFNDTGGGIAGGRVIKSGQITTIVNEKRAGDGKITYEYVNTQELAGNGYVTVTSTGAGDGRGPGYGTTGTDLGTGGTTGTTGTGIATCGGPGLPACGGSGSAVCGAPPLPACKIDFGEISPAPGDPTSKTTSEIDGMLAMPSLVPFKTFSLPGHSSVCPTTTINAFSRSFVMDAHCALLDAHTALLRAAMIAVFGLSALFTVLKA